MDIVQIATGFVFGLVFVAPFFLKAKGIIKEIKDILVAIDKGLEDGSISTQEAVDVLKEIKELVAVVRK